ncbi:hypothetical protein [Streptomyces tanashiensis]|uniref:Uncharacterized protein n=1 Tax=Streptomyces tanashiensis TaxID=67367 RepID=A0ABY6RB26_9ACTN|nr:hypothetical protein [Streptomyces tanashiensis]UZX26799.1 hypothetical protein LDH80_17245 [Streptomyces tanashiensis]
MYGMPYWITAPVLPFPELQQLELCRTPSMAEALVWTALSGAVPAGSRWNRPPLTPACGRRAATEETAASWSVTSSAVESPVPTKPSRVVAPAVGSISTTWRTRAAARLSRVVSVQVVWVTPGLRATGVPGVQLRPSGLFGSSTAGAAVAEVARARAATMAARAAGGR